MGYGWGQNEGLEADDLIATKVKELSDGLQSYYSFIRQGPHCWFLPMLSNYYRPLLPILELDGHNETG